MKLAETISNAYIVRDAGAVWYSNATFENLEFCVLTKRLSFVHW